ncbi:MAG: ABC transporter, partial [Dehalococcoidia bacterium]
DEPTLGLDVSMQVRIRRFVAEYNRRTGATVLLTSHYMDDVVALCKRVLVIHRGRLLYDGDLAAQAGRMAPYKLVRLTFRADANGVALEPYGEVTERADQRVTVRIPRDGAAERTARLVRDLEPLLADISVEDPPIEEVIDRVFTAERSLEPAALGS